MKSKILILLFYYNRPNLVKIALNSIKNHNYDNWELSFIDDGSEHPGEPIVREILSDHLNKIKFYNTNDSIDAKLSRCDGHGAMFGKYAQLAIEESNADIVMMLCDDDALYPEYFNNLNEYFESHPSEKYVYSHIHVYDPILTKIENNPSYYHHHLNKNYPLNPYYNIDASQVAWIRKSYVESNIQFPYPKTVDFDAVIFNQMYNKFGNCNFSGFLSQYKAIDMGAYKDQLSYRMGRILGGYNKIEDIYKISVK